jgi:hypothetical protein
VFAERSTDRRAEWIPTATEFYAQKAMPSYFGNAGPSVPRPDERTLVVMPAETEAMFGARILSEGAVAALRADPSLDVTVNPWPGTPGIDGALVCRVFPDANVSLSTAADAHGVATTSVKITPEKASPTGQVVLTRDVQGRQVPLIVVSSGTYDAVYDNAGAGTPRLEPGRYVRLINAEILTGFLNPLFVVMLTPVVVWFFAQRVKAGRPVSTARKIFYGMVITTVSLLVMALGARMGDDGAAKTSMMWLAAYYLIITAGELCLSPMGLSLVTKLAPARLVGLMMGGWFLSTAVGNKMSGFISGLEPSTAMFVVLALAILAVAGFIFVMLPRLDAAIKRYGA